GTSLPRTGEGAASALGTASARIAIKIRSAFGMPGRVSAQDLQANLNLRVHMSPGVCHDANMRWRNSMGICALGLVGFAATAAEPGRGWAARFAAPARAFLFWLTNRGKGPLVVGRRLEGRSGPPRGARGFLALEDETAETSKAARGPFLRWGVLAGASGETPS